ncbi:MAG: CPBP family intramembrane metalloprotease [Clostridia bacterium]|nr:CPBP family intramembrane metalloprotease [Clostridia bacterium]
MYNCAMENFENTRNGNAPQPQKGFALPLGAKAGGLSYSVTVLINLIVSIIFSGVILIFNLTGTDGEKYISLLVSPVAIAVVLTLALKVAKQPARRLLPVKTHPKYYLIGALLIFGLLFSLSSVNEYLIKLFELLGYQRRESFLPDMSGWKIVPVFIAIAVIPPVMEEIIFRGILLQNAEEDVGSVRAIFITGLCFSLYHGSVEQTVYQFICGCLFAFLAVRSRSVLPSLMMHFINNALIIILMACGATDPQSGEIIMSDAVNIALTVLSAAALIGGTVWLVLDKTQLKECRKGGVKAFFIFASVGIGVMVVMWVAGLFIS